MALDGLVISNIVYELSQTLTGGRINKIYQPEPDALILGIKNNRTNYKLLISASASLPLIYLTDDTPANPAVAPNFCMLLRNTSTAARFFPLPSPDWNVSYIFILNISTKWGMSVKRYSL